MTAFRPDGANPRENFGAFVPGPRLVVEGVAEGPLSGLTFAAKDLFDVAGQTTGCGSPDWADSHAPAEHHAVAVERLLAAGARLVGKTVTDEISLGLLGRNRHHGTPINPHAPDRFPGGSSSGSAVAVAAGLVDIALGSDTGGSMRVPASFCGIYGIRPTHGAIPVDGLMTQAPSFDTAGFFTADAALFARVGEVLLPEAAIGDVEEVLFVGDGFALADAEVREALEPGRSAVAGEIATSRSVTLAEEGLATWNRNHVHLQHPEFGATFGPWVDAVDPRLSAGVAAAIAGARRLPEAAHREAAAFRAAVRERVDALLDGRRVLCLPTTPMLPPLRDISLPEIGAVDDRIVSLTCIAGLTGLPQLSLPLGSAGGLPVGLSLIGWRGSDRTLIDLARRIGRPQ